MFKTLFAVGVCAVIFNHFGQKLNTNSPEEFLSSAVSAAPAIREQAVEEFTAKGLPEFKRVIADLKRESSSPTQQVEAVNPVKTTAYFLNPNPNTSFKFCYRTKGKTVNCYGEPLESM